jgi:hypothetical protein
MTRAELTRFWDGELANWLNDRPLTRELEDWKRAYRGELEEWAFPEPFIGDILGSPRVILLANNPGAAKPELQSRTGIFAAQIAQVGFTRWASTRPFDGPTSPWVRTYGPIRHTVQRREFARRFLQDASLDYLDMLTIELYPWHSPTLKGSIRVPPHILREFVIGPLAEFDSSTPVLALARGWATALDRVPELIQRVDHVDGFAVPSRRARIYTTHAGGRIVVVWHSGSDAPPQPADAERLRRAWFDER